MLLAALVALAAYASALRGASPLILISEQVKLDRSIAESPRDMLDEASLIQSAVKNCQYDGYFFVDQPGVNGRELLKPNLPHLSHLMDKSEAYSVHDMVLNSEMNDVFDYIKTRCGAKEVAVNSHTGEIQHYVDSAPRLFNIQFDSGDVAAHDETLYQILGRIPSGNIFVAYRPRGATDSLSDGGAIVQNKTLEPSLDPLYNSLFENYKFLSPGILSGTLVVMILYPILHIALKAVSSLQITTKAFEKQERQSQSKQG